jgi:hypothetical protein
MAMSELPPVPARPIACIVSLWPDGHDCEDVAGFCLEVTCRGSGGRAIGQGWAEGSRKPVMDAGGHWHLGPPGLRFTGAAALALARQHAPAVTVRGVTAAEACRIHDQRGRPGGPAAARSPEAGT